MSDPTDSQKALASFKEALARLGMPELPTDPPADGIGRVEVALAVKANELRALARPYDRTSQASWHLIQSLGADRDGNVKAATHHANRVAEELKWMTETP